MNNDFFKITIERLVDNKSAYFFVNGIDLILESEYFNTEITDALTGERFTIKQRIYEQLSNQSK